MVEAFHQVFLLFDRFEVDHGQVAALGKRAFFIEDIGNSPRHAGGEVPAGGPDHDHDAARHVLAAVVARAFDHRDRARVTDREALAGDAAEVAFAGDRSVQHGVADDDRKLCDGLGVLRGTDDEFAAGEPFPT
jgi:hypothetical protein